MVSLKTSHSVILIPQLREKNLGSNLERSTNGDKQRCFAKPVLSEAEGLNMTTPFIEWVLTRLGEVKLHLDELLSPGPASEP
jgi:hypothetical protein